ncbi:hypothetical protein QBC44DRAFT_364950 [Cladorrhinum sp. PSN332]|nr:hypothetical protein QBC44DRAFT_364950 [Cladorrhinum sp. PSN332]
MNHKCQSKGCHNEVLYKTLDSAFVDPQDRHSRSPPYQRYGNGRAQVSSYCELHTCSHFLKNEGCPNKKPPHDSVCPQRDCVQARAQFLDPNFDPMSSASPVYARYDVCPDHKCTVRQCPRRREPETPFCSNHACKAGACLKRRQGDRESCEDHQCKSRGCRGITDGEFPYCAQHIKCSIHGCGGVRHFDPKTQEYLESCTKHITCPVPRCREVKKDRSAFCEGHTCNERGCIKSSTVSAPYCDEHRCTEDSCPNPRTWAANPKVKGRFCPLHTCRTEDCQGFVDRLAIFCQTHGCSKPKCHQESIVENLCLDHLKHHYTTLGRRRALHRSQPKPKQPGHDTPPPSNKLHESDFDSDSDVSHPVTDASASNRGRTILRPGSTLLGRPIELGHTTTATQHPIRGDVSEASYEEEDEDAGTGGFGLSHDGEAGNKKRGSVMHGPDIPPLPPGSGKQGGQRMSPVRKGTGEKHGSFARTSTGTLNGVGDGSEAAKRGGAVRQQGGPPAPGP